jgi:hypothetical protein
MTTQSETWQAHAREILDVRPDLERGDEPFVRILQTAERLQPGEAFVLIAPFEPQPLYGVLGGRGFTYETERVADDEWIVRFTREPAATR